MPSHTLFAIPSDRHGGLLYYTRRSTQTDGRSAVELFRIYAVERVVPLPAQLDFWVVKCAAPVLILQTPGVVFNLATIGADREGGYLFN
jgi:hypothetical protein